MSNERKVKIAYIILAICIALWAIGDIIKILIKGD
jgi:hypothetical protein